MGADVVAHAPLRSGRTGPHAGRPGLARTRRERARSWSTSVVRTTTERAHSRAGCAARRTGARASAFRSNEERRARRETKAVRSGQVADLRTHSSRERGLHPRDARDGWRDRSAATSTPTCFRRRLRTRHRSRLGLERRSSSLWHVCSTATAALFRERGAERSSMQPTADEWDVWTPHPAEAVPRIHSCRRRWKAPRESSSIACPQFQSEDLHQPRRHWRRRAETVDQHSSGRTQPSRWCR